MERLASSQAPGSSAGMDRSGSAAAAQSGGGAGPGSPAAGSAPALDSAGSGDGLGRMGSEVGRSSSGRLRRAVSRQESLGTCLICASHRRQNALVPCGHLVACAACTELVLKGPTAQRRCPVCKEKVRARSGPFLPCDEGWLCVGDSMMCTVHHAGTCSILCSAGGDSSSLGSACWQRYHVAL
jgi:hypothetical protein